MARNRRGEANEWLSSDDTRTNFIAKYGDDGPGKCQLGLYGWRRRCLFCVLILLLFLVVMNLALTLWLFKVMEFSSDGIGSIRVGSGGIQLRGQAYVLDNLIASRIRSRKSSPIRFESYKNITLRTRTSDGRVLNEMVLGKDKLECQGSSLKISDSRGELLFSADHGKVVIGAAMLRVTGEGGAIFHGSVQTPLVRAEPGHELRLESPTRTMELLAPLGIAIESRAGDISATSLTDMKFISIAGAVRLDAPNIYMPKLQTASLNGAKLPQAGVPVHSTQPRITQPEVFQVCVCAKGRLFLAPAEGNCAADQDVCR